MYTHATTSFGPYTKHAIRSAQSGQSFSFIPEHGACLLDIVFGETDILLGHESPEAVTQNSGAKSGLLFPFPNRLAGGTYIWRGQTYHFPQNDKSGPNAIHGFGMNKPFTVDNIDLDEHSALVECHYQYDGERENYPFPFDFRVTFRMEDGGRFEMRLSLVNTGKEPLPAGMGYHPYFLLADRVDEVSLQLPRVERVKINENMIPTGEREPYTQFEQLRPVGEERLDTCFALRQDHGRVEVQLEGPRGRLQYWQEADTYGYLQVYTPKDRSSIALEPMTCNVDAFNNGDGLRTLDPGAALEGAFGLRFSPRG